MTSPDEICRLIAAGEWYGARRVAEQLEALPNKCLNQAERRTLLFDGARVRIHLGDYHLAEEGLREYLALAGPDGPGAAQALTNLGLAVAEQGRQEEALHHWRRVLSLAPSPALRHTIRHAMAWALIELGNLDAARDEISIMDSEALAAYQRRDVLLCTAYERLRAIDITGAGKAALAIEDDPDATVHQRAHALWILAELAAAIGDMPGARGLLAESTRLATEPPRPWLLNQLGGFRRRLQEQERSVS